MEIRYRPLKNKKNKAKMVRRIRYRYIMNKTLLPACSKMYYFLMVPLVLNIHMQLSWQLVTSENTLGYALRT